MAEVEAAPVVAMEGVADDAAPAAPEQTVPAEPEVPEEPEFTSETLYIQNLNEKIKIDGDAHPLPYIGV